MKPLLLLVGLAATLVGCASYESAYVEPADYSYYDYGATWNYRYYEPQYQYYKPRCYRHYGQPGYYCPSRRHRTWYGYLHGKTEIGLATDDGSV
jgi:hypothetical protein